MKDIIDLSSKEPIQRNLGLLLDIGYQRYREAGEERAEIVLYIRDKTRNRNRIYIRGFLPYFYINTGQSELESLLDKSEQLQQWFVSSESRTKYLYNGRKRVDLIKIYGKQPWMVPTILTILDNYQIKYYEADIPFVQRFLIDYGLYGLKYLQINTSKNQLTTIAKEDTLVVLSLDIEIDSSEDSDEISESIASILDSGNRRITAISFWWGVNQSAGHNKVFRLQEDTDSAEQNFIVAVFRYLWDKIDPDIIVTYNGDRFDIPYLIKRIDVLDLSSKLLSPHGDSPEQPIYRKGWTIPGVLVYDLFRRTRWIHTADGKKSLNSVAQELLGQSKLELSDTHGDIWKNSLSNPKVAQLFEQYSLKDAELTYKLYFAMHIPEWLEVIKITGTPPGEAMYYTERQSGEFLVLHIMYQSDILIPPAPSSEEKKLRKKERISAKGGLVIVPTKDIATAVLICDFTSMYPSIIASHNIGAESFEGLNRPPRQRFNQQYQTSMAMMQEEMLKKRVQVKEQLKEGDYRDEGQRQKLQAYNQALKIVANSTFGSYNFIGSRFYNTDIAGSITQIGRDYLREVSSNVENFGEGYHTIYGDTDSVFIATPLQSQITELWHLPVDRSNEYSTIIPEINQLITYLHEILPSKMKLELQDIAYRILFHKGAKKRYTYVSALTKQVTIIGFEAVRHDWSPFSKDIQEQAIEIILMTGDLKQAKQMIIKYIQNKLKGDRQELKQEMITFGPIKRDPKDYQSTTPAVAAFLDYAAKNDMDPSKSWRYHDYFPYIIVKGRGNLSNRALHPDYVHPSMVDIDHYIERSLSSINRFNLDISLYEVKDYLFRNLEEFF